jgi:hypothetical protein
VTISTTHHDNKGVSTANPVKQLHRIAGKSLIVIDESLLNRLDIGEDSAWFEQALTNEGILLRLKLLDLKGDGL